VAQFQFQYIQQVQLGTLVKENKMIEETKESIAQHYSAAMDSVNLILGDKPEWMTDADWVDCLVRNKEHLKIMLAKDFWTDEDLTPLQLASE
jgi:hypothetical protein